MKDTIKLNLGCGEKLFPSVEHHVGDEKNDVYNRDIWINVDIVKPTKSTNWVEPRFTGFDDIRAPFFVQSDLLNVSNVIEENYADHIFTSHVIEHIPIYDLDDLLKSWLKILKPGGTVAFEMPDVVKCCINILQLHTSRELQLVDRLGLMGLYGEQFKETPYMIHRWGWTFLTLAPILQRCGFVDIVETEPVTHMGPIRDFRIEARKPL